MTAADSSAKSHSGGTLVKCEVSASSHPGDGSDFHFRTSHLMADLKGRSIRGAVVTTGAQGIKFALQMGSTMVLARLLTPADFGLIAMVTAVTGFVVMFRDAGLSLATVQSAHITHAQVSALFWINVALSVAVMLFTIALAPMIVWFYSEPRLLSITYALAATFVFGGLTVQHQALLQRQMKFRALATIEILSMAAGILTAIVVALQGFGYWALVMMNIGSTGVNCGLVWMFSKWRPSWPVRETNIGDMLRFGGGLTSFNFLNYFTRNADNIIVGHTLGGTALGVYSKAYGLLMMPIQQINGPVGNVMVPSLSRLQKEPERFRRAFLHAIGMLGFIGMPMVAFLYVVADQAVAILLGSGWEDAAKIFRCLAPAALLGTVNVAPGWLCISLGRARVQVIWAAISAPITVAAFMVGIRWGITGVAAGFSISWCLLFILFVAMACYGSPVSFVDLAKCLFVPLFAAIISAAGCLILAQPAQLTNSSILWSAVASFILFATLYLFVSLAFPSGRSRIIALWRDGLGALTPSKS